MLRPDELAAARTAAAKTLPDLASIGRVTWVETAGGGYSGGDTPTTIATAVPCRIGPLSGYGELGIAGETVTPDTQARVHLPWGTDVQVGDVITIDDVDYPVLGVTQRSEAIRLLKRVTVQCA